MTRHFSQSQSSRVRSMLILAAALTLGACSTDAPTATRAVNLTVSSASSAQLGEELLVRTGGAFAPGVQMRAVGQSEASPDAVAHPECIGEFASHVLAVEDPGGPGRPGLLIMTRRLAPGSIITVGEFVYINVCSEYMHYSARVTFVPSE